MAQIVPVQCFIARTVLGWSVRKLANVAEVSAHTVANFEGGGALKAKTVQVIQHALEKAGIIFIEANDGGPGARLRTQVGPLTRPRA
jgi:transcriptional regulator with XRE-family HTH domain